MLQMHVHDDGNNQDLTAVSGYYIEEEKLNVYLASNPQNGDLIENSLGILAQKMEAIKEYSSAQWKETNRVAYNGNVDFLITTWDDKFSGMDRFGGTILQEMTNEEEAFQGMDIGDDPPDGDIAAVEDVGRVEIGIRVISFIGGALFWGVGIASIAMAGVKITANLAAKEVAKKATTFALRQATQQLAIQYAAEASAYVVSWAALFYGGGRLIRRAFPTQPPQQQPAGNFVP